MSASEHVSKKESRTTSALPYLSILIVGIAISTYLQYLWQYFYPGIPVILGQAPGIWGTGLTLSASFISWLFCRRPPVKTKWGVALFALLLTGWFIHFALLVSHGDPYDYTVFVYPIVVGMLAARLPSTKDMESVFSVLGWTLSLLLIWTRLSELLGIIPMAPVSADLIEFEVREYWLPLSGTLGPEGRWPGPLAGTAFTGMAGALLLVLGVVLRSRSSLLFAGVGLIVLLLTSSRGAFAAAAAGVAVALLFSNSWWLARVTVAWRIVVAVSGCLLVLAMLIRSSPNLTGRTTFWVDFLNLWFTSPITGVGATGYQQGTNWTITAGSAHSLYLDDLARNGLLGLSISLSTLIVALTLAFRSAKASQSGPIALLVTFFVLGIVNTPITWVNPSFLWILLVLSAVWALAYTRTRPCTQNSDRIDMLSKQLSNYPESRSAARMPSDSV